MSGRVGGKPFVFIPARLRKEFSRLSEAQKYYTKIATSTHFKPSRNYGVFVTLTYRGVTYQHQQIN